MDNNRKYVNTTMSRVDHVYEDLRRAIISGELAPNSWIRPRDLSYQYDVSYIPIREAMRKLESERLIVYARNRGARVAPVIEDEVRDLFDTRIVLETDALRRSLSVLRPADIAAMWAVREAMLDSIARGDSRSHELHRKLHMSLYEAVKSPWLDGLIELLWDHSERYRRLLSQKGLFYDQGDVRHKALLEAVSAVDFDAAAAALRRDLERGRDDMISMLRQDRLGVVTDASTHGSADVEADATPSADAAATVAALADRR